jgi:hypothetical protein
VMLFDKEAKGTDGCGDKRIGRATQ